MKRFSGVFSSLAVVLAIAGCGGSSNTSHPKTEDARPQATSATTADVAAAVTKAAEAGVSHEEFIRNLNVYCSTGNAKIEGLQRRYSAAADREDYAGAAAVLGDVLKYYDVAMAKLRMIIPAPEDKAAFARYTHAVRRQAGAMARVRAAIVKRDFESVQAFLDIVSEAKKRRIVAAIDMGADKCGQ